MKPKLKQMSDQQLRDYIKQHRTNDEAIAELFVNRRSSDSEATWYTTVGIKETEDIIRQRLPSQEGASLERKSRGKYKGEWQRMYKPAVESAIHHS